MFNFLKYMKANNTINGLIVWFFFVFIAITLWLSWTCIVLVHNEIKWQYCLLNFDYFDVFISFFITLVSITALLFSAPQINSTQCNINKDLIAVEWYILLYSIFRLILLFSLFLLLSVFTKKFWVQSIWWYICWIIFWWLSCILIYKICMSWYVSTLKLVKILKEKIINNIKN